MLGLLAALSALCFSAQGRAESLAWTVGDARLEPLTFDDLPGWRLDDHRLAFETFIKTCRAIIEDVDALKTARPASDDLRAVCRAALDAEGAPDPRSFFERWFRPYEVVPPGERGFLTGYFEPEFQGALTASAEFPVPLLARPLDLVTVPRGESWPGLEGLQAARRTERGVGPYPDRAAIEDGALGSLAQPVLYLRDAVDAFIVHVQGSARIRLPDRRTVRVAYAGKNGHPFTAIGRVIVERGHVPLAEMNLERLTAWLRENPAEAREIMRLNRSYVFFRLVEELGPNDGPIGAAGVPLTPERSLAVDRHLWSYGLPFWLEGELPAEGRGVVPLARLMIAQDTGSAILGPARGDYFFGSGHKAGTRAGRLRHRVRFVVLWPKGGLPSASPGP